MGPINCLVMTYKNEGGVNDDRIELFWVNYTFKENINSTTLYFSFYTQPSHWFSDI